MATRKTLKFANDGERIYVVVARKILHPLLVVSHGRDAGKPSFGRGRETREIVQPFGRMTAQGIHAGRMVEHEMLLGALPAILPLKGDKVVLNQLLEKLPFESITTIVLEARDTFELLHVKRLLEDDQRRGVRVVEFHDTNESAYGTPDKVLTAIATHPISPLLVTGALDYLPKLEG